MRAVTAFLRDGRRSQRGSVLSAVLIIVAFLGIISGAVMTALSTNFLLSNALLNRVNTEATVSSAAELAINKLQSIPVRAQCPGPIVSPVLNNRTAVADITSCWPTVYEPAKFTLVANAAKPFSVDGTHARLGGLNDYVVGNPDGTVYDYRFDPSVSGSTVRGSLRWTLPLSGSAVTGTPLVIDDPNQGGQYLDLIPASGSVCSPAANCVSVRSDDGSSQPPRSQCPIAAAGGPVLTQPFLSPSFGTIAYFSAGTDLTSIDVNECEPADNTTIPLGQPVVAGPVAVRCRSGCGRNTDEVYAVVSDSGSSSIVRYTYRGGFTPAQVLRLPWGAATGMALSGPNLSRIAISFNGGGGRVSLVTIAADGSLALARTTPQPLGGIANPPYWCAQCGDLIGVGTLSGLYVFDSTLNPYAAPTAGSASISTTPQADTTGNYWFFGADNGYVYEAQVAAGQPVMVYGKRFGPMAQFGSSVQVGDCRSNTWICVYLGAVDTNAYLIALDSRDSVVTACITVASPNCTPGVNPRVWTNVEVGTVTDSKAVHVQGWSYYSP